MAAETPGSPEDYSLFLSENGHLSFENPNYQVITGYWLDRLWRWYWYTRSNIDFENSAFPHWFFWGSYFIIIWTDWWLYLPFLQFLRRILPCSQQLLRSRFLPCNFFHITFLPLSSDFLPQSISWSYDKRSLFQTTSVKGLQSFDIDGQSVNWSIGLWRWPTSTYTREIFHDQKIFIHHRGPSCWGCKKTFSPKAKFFSSFIVPTSKSSPASFDVKQNGSQLLVQCSDVTETEIHVKVRELRKPSNRKFIGSGYKVYTCRSKYILEV